MSFDVFDSSGKRQVVNSIANMPIGSMISIAFSTVPAGWLKCDGTAVSRTTYAELFNAIGTAYGTGDGSTTFNLPYASGQIIYALPVAKAGSNLLPPVSDGSVTTAKLDPNVGNFGAWGTWTPALTSDGTQPNVGSTGGGSGTYVQIGKLVIAKFYLSFAGTGVSAGSGTYFISLPVTEKNRGAVAGTGFIYDSAPTPNYQSVLYRHFYSSGAATSKVYMEIVVNSSYTGAVNGGFPWTWSTNDQMSGFLMYEAA